MSHLKIVRDEPPKKRRKWRRSGSALTAEQQGKVRAALKNLRFAYGGWAPLAEVMSRTEHQLSFMANRGSASITGDVLVRVCKAGGLSADAMLSEPLNEAGRCRSCGAKRLAS